MADVASFVRFVLRIDFGSLEVSHKLVGFILRIGFRVAHELWTFILKMNLSSLDMIRMPGMVVGMGTVFNVARRIEVCTQNEEPSLWSGVRRSRDVSTHNSHASRISFYGRMREP